MTLDVAGKKHIKHSYGRQRVKILLSGRIHKKKIVLFFFFFLKNEIIRNCPMRDVVLRF